MNLHKLNGNAVDSELQLSNTPLKENFEFTEFESTEAFQNILPSRHICSDMRTGPE